MTVLIYVNTSKQVGDIATSRSLPTKRPCKNGLMKTILRASPLNMRCLSEPHRPAYRHCHPVNRRAVDYLASLRVRLA